MAPVIVCGYGQVGYRVTRLLLDLGEQVTVVTLAGRDEWLRQARERGAKIFIGDARDEAVLEESGLADAKAIIVCADDDATNIEIALDARRIRPDFRIVARMFDQNLARQAEEHLGIDRTIAVSATAATAFAATVFGDRVLTQFNLANERLVVMRVDGPATLEDAPIVVTSKSGAKAGDGLRTLAQGDSAVVVARVSSLSDQGLPDRKITAASALLRSVNPFYVARFIWSVWINTSAQLRATLISIAAVIVVSVAVFSYGMGLSPIDAFYFVVTTATTTGYGDFTPKDAAIWVKLYACFMMLVSAAGMAVLFSMVTDYIVTARLMQLVGRQRIPERDHVVVVGIGSVGFRTVEELLRMGVSVVAVDVSEDGQHLNDLRTRVPVIVGDARTPETLRRAGVNNARALISTTSSDAVNLSVGLAAKELNADVHLTLGIFDGGFAAKVQAISEVAAALSASKLAAPAFVGAALFENPVASFRLGSQFFTLCEEPKGDMNVFGSPMVLRIRDLQEVPKKGR